MKTKTFYASLFCFDHNQDTKSSYLMDHYLPLNYFIDEEILSSSVLPFEGHDQFFPVNEGFLKRADERFSPGDQVNQADQTEQIWCATIG